MSARVYILTDIDEVNSTGVLPILQSVGGVAVDILEGHPNTMLIIEAPDRETLAERTIQVQDIVEGIASNVRLIMNKEDAFVPCFPAAAVCERTSVN